MPFELRVRLLAYGALAGFFINLSCYALGVRYRRWLETHTVRQERVLLAAVYFGGGCIGFALASAVSAATSLVPLRVIQELVPYFGIISGGTAIVVGLLFYTFGVLQERLRESVERLKEHEFAEKELELARSIQKRLLPPPELEGETWRLAARNVAARFVAGDFRSSVRASSSRSPTRVSSRMVASLSRTPGFPIPTSCDPASFPAPSECPDRACRSVSGRTSSIGLSKTASSRARSSSSSPMACPKLQPPRAVRSVIRRWSGFSTAILRRPAHFSTVSWSVFGERLLRSPKTTGRCWPWRGRGQVSTCHIEGQVATWHVET